MIFFYLLYYHVIKINFKILKQNYEKLIHFIINLLSFKV